uniref:DNA replication complex GINS protein PSF1 C-terminal domain-containing protein n=1 Tax=Pseudo-nitzschia australis TaxID=44445 RepID=A0A7S4AWX4_9STRA|mmetsp:Transcript_9038/g.19510  ORF Transcript_9038/g.19510 Transcript_9038/m.19510 type:complete len:248 (+) Transcript_9038:95-838(+)|eukprot:CAMPEP_0168186028 /NCGR_PEP_ID=MMETSP0139_2-20121125/14190_1 /TAXON_ID=44445 /ORGANISM="Pseudo-nitzschia australis, Strain 10249 10 AB" /LENGTH=247 /DNA_ID=CAMNT_0008107961 /DNA_START=16 /DNA_END=759 /DNA_ORIENTATION=-
MAIATSTRTRNSHAPLLPTSGRELLLDLKRSTAQHGGGARRREISTPPSTTLPAYNHKLVQACFRDLHATAQELDLQAQVHGSSGSAKPSMSARPSILLHNKTIQRQKQCLLAYHHHRMEIVKDIERAKMAANESHVGNSSTNTCTNGNANTNAPISTNAQEVAFARDYASLRNAYSNQVFELDLLPPTSHMVQVRVRKTIGQVVLPDSGRVVALTHGACLFLDRADAKDFLRQGIVQLYDGEEVDF